MKKAFLFDWGNTIMKDFPDEIGPMAHWNKIQIMPNGDRVLDELSKRAVCCLATNAKDSNKEEICKALARVNIKMFFHDVFCYREIGYSKPSKEYFEYIVKKLKMSKNDILMIGDSLETDVQGALNFGFEAVLYDPSNLYPIYKGVRITDLKELLTLY